MNRFFSLGLLFSMLAASAFSCTVNWGPDQAMVSETRDLEPFSRILIKGGANVILLKGDKPSVQIEARQRIYDLLKISVEDGQLIIDTVEKGIYIGGHDRLTLHITYTELTEFETNGGANITAESFSGTSLTFLVNGGGNINIEDLRADALKITVNGGANITLAGKVQSQELVFHGGANYNGKDLEAQDLSLTITGAGNADIWVRQNLKLNLAGVYSVNYWGLPDVEQSLGGVGSLKAKGDKQ